jgi:AcrR family transcriptional regulator
VSRRTRTPLSKERVLRAALALADAEGLDALSMRRLAKELGVEAMSLYNHVQNKNEILDGIVAEVVAEMELPEGVDWRTAIRRNAISTRDAYVRHPWACSLSMSLRRSSDMRLEHGNWLLKTLREAGFSPDVRYHALHFLDAYVFGYAVQQISFSSIDEDVEELAERFVRSIDVDRYPDFVEHVQQHLEPRDEQEGGFELGLDLILDGLERMRA